MTAGGPVAEFGTVHGTSTAAGSLARIATFALDPLYRADPEREWPALASAIYWLDQ